MACRILTALVKSEAAETRQEQIVLTEVNETWWGEQSEQAGLWVKARLGFLLFANVV